MLLSYLLCSSLLSSSFASYVVNLQMPKPKKTENKELLGTFCTILSCSRTKVKSENKFPQKIAKSSYPTMYQGKSPVHKLYWFQYFLLDVLVFYAVVIMLLSSFSSLSFVKPVVVQKDRRPKKNE